MSHFEKVSFEQWKADCGVKGLPDKELREWYEAIKLPRQATASSAGCDFYMPFNLNFESGSVFRIATGVRWVTDPDAEADRGRVLLIVPRSGLGFRYRLQLNNTVGVIDSDYYDSDNEGHIFIKMTNDSNEGKTCVIERGTAFAQGIFMPFGITADDDTSEVRNGGFGSTSR
jgi:dUTP pyrophosphatase